MIELEICERMVLIAVFILFVLCWRPSDGAVLPQWVYRINSCPDPYNVSKWIAASKRLNCFHKLTSVDSNEQAMVYHCMPSSFLNETVEFCGRNVPVDTGHCPIYNYEVVHNTRPTYYTCNNFASGCPSATFNSKEVYKHPACLEIDSNMNCFKAEKNCTHESTVSTSTEERTTTEKQKTSTSTEERTTTEKQKTSTSTEERTTTEKQKTSTSTEERTTTEKQKTSTSTEERTTTEKQKTITILIKDDTNSSLRDRSDIIENLNKKHAQEREVFIIIISTIIIICIIIVTSLILFRRNYISNRCMNHKKTTSISKRELSELRQNQIECFEEIELRAENEQLDNNEEAGRKALMSNMYNDAKMWQYNDFLQNLKKGMTTEMVNFIKCRLQEQRENEPDDLNSINEPFDLLKYLEKKYNTFDNVVYLQGIFLACKAPKLYDRCVEYAKRRGEEIMYFEKRLLERYHTKVIYVINCPDMSKYSRTELEKLRVMLATLLNAQFDDVIVSGIKNGCVIVTFMIRNCLISKLRALYTPEKRSMTCQWMLKLPLKYKVLKVIVQDETIYPSDDVLPQERSNVEEKPSEKVQDVPLNSNAEIQMTDLSVDKVSNILECNDNATSNLKVSNILECNDNATSNLQKRDFATDIVEEKSSQGLQEFHAFLERTGSCITDDTLHEMKTILRDLMDQECVRKMNTTRLLNELSDTFKLQYNMSFLEWIFEKCGDHQLVEKCQKFSSGYRINLECFQTNFIACGRNQHLKLQLMMAELESHTSEVQDIRYWLAKSINLHPGQIIMTALQSGPIVVTFMMKEAYIKTFLKYIKTDDGQIAASRRRVEKVMKNETVINIDKALNGSNFIHVRLRYQRNGFQRLGESVRTVASSILRRTGMSLDGNEIYIRPVQSESKEKAARENSSFENFMQRNQKSLLDNLEPRSIMTNSKISPLFDSKMMTKMETFENRGERANYFLEICRNLPNDEQGKVVALLREMIVSSKEIPEIAELGPARCWIQENQETLLDEIDTDFIETTINHMEDVPNEVYTSWMDQSKGRKEKAKIFLKFALRKDEYVLALQKTLKENGIECMKVEID